MPDTKELSFEEAVRWLTAHAGTAVWVAVSTREGVHLLTLATVLQVPEGETWRPLPGTPVELEPDQLERATIRASTSPRVSFIPGRLSPRFRSYAFAIAPSASDATAILPAQYCGSAEKAVAAAV